MATGMKTTLPKGQPAKEKDCPAKPYADFPLFPHATRRWAKKIRGHLHYFDPWDDPQGSLERYLEDKDDLHAGRTPKPKEGELTIQELSNQFLRAKRPLVDSKEITAQTWADYRAACVRFLKFFGKLRLVTDLAPDDFARYRAA